MTDEAFESLSKAAAIHNAHNPRGMVRTLLIYAMTHLRAGQPEEALASLQSAWQLQELTEEHIVHSTYPKHSGDLVLLARIKYAQGLKQEAQQLASRTISIRRSIYGEKGPRVADSMFIIARLLEADGEDVLAARILRTIYEISRGVSEMQGHLSRALWFLAMLESKMGDEGEAQKLRLEAKIERDKIGGREAPDSDADDSFMNLVGWMLW